MSGTGRTRSDKADAGISDGDPSSPATSALTAADVQRIVLETLRQ